MTTLLTLLALLSLQSSDEAVPTCGSTHECKNRQESASCNEELSFLADRQITAGLECCNAYLDKSSFRQSREPPEESDCTKLELTSNGYSTSNTMPACNSVSDNVNKQSGEGFIMSLSSNLILNAILIPNIETDIYLGKNISASINGWFSWWSQNSKHRYWRTYGGCASFRYWFGPLARAEPLTGNHAGLYAKAFLYDFEWGKTGFLSGTPGKNIAYKPTWSIGIEYGYTLPVKGRLKIDFDIAFGYLQGQYMKYYPKDGHNVWMSTHMRRWIGPTNIGISLKLLIGKQQAISVKGGTL